MSASSPLAKLEQQTWLEAWLPQLRAELEALRPYELKIDVPTAICTVYGVLPKLQQWRGRIADELPRFDLKLEKRSDHLVSTLRRAVRALGGDLEVTAVVGNKRIKLSI